MTVILKVGKDQSETVTNITKIVNVGAGCSCLYRNNNTMIITTEDIIEIEG